jgi:glycosyltransferase involved in cell wall biosynthesis
MAIRFCDKVISVSNATADWLVQKRGVPRRKVLVIPYGVNLKLYRPGRNLELRKKIGLPVEARVVGVVARLHPQKGHRYLIEAAQTIVRAHPKVRFVLVGDGELRGELEQMVLQSNLAEHFLFLGFRDDVRDLLQIFDLFVLPSLYEGLPNVILEAMASGLPVVATSVDGTKELIVDNETGFLVPPKDSAALAEKIGLLLADKERSAIFGLKGRQRVEAHYSLELEVKSFQNLYEKYTGR